MDNGLACEGNIIHEEAVAAVCGQMLSEAVFSAAANFFKVMGDGTRFRILYALDKQELCVCDLANLLGMSVSAVSHQLARLRESQLVKGRRDGKNMFYTIADDHIHVMLKGCVEHAMEEQA
ncbi:MAG: winged helix-turn-helix transcriptional regulator [Clostridiales bacterium]|nr:winged helix-turn-helix transcriptional regulator [Clostridiales bacterium]